MKKRCEKYFERVIAPEGIGRGVSLKKLVDTAFTSFNARVLRDICHLFTECIYKEDTTVGLSLAGALIPAGVGRSCLVPLIKGGYVDWIVSTGANLYHDLHNCLGYYMYEGTPHADDRKLRRDEVVRIHDLYFDADALFETDRFIRTVFRGKEWNGPIASAELHRVLGEELLRQWPDSHRYSVLAAAARTDAPVHTSSPGDSSIGMNLAGLALEGKSVAVDVNLDVNLTAAWVYDAKKSGGKTAAFIIGGGSPKNFLLQTEPHIQEVLGLKEAGHDFFIQLTDARIDTGGLSGATPSEAVSWGKIDPKQLNRTQVCYGDCTVYLPLITAYILNGGIKRKLRRLWKRREECLSLLTKAYQKSSRRGN